MNVLDRRTLIAATAAALAAPGLAEAAMSDPWLAYDRRLRRLLAEDRGDFDPDFETDLRDLGDIFRRGRSLSALAPDPGLALAPTPPTSPAPATSTT